MSAHTPEPWHVRTLDGSMGGIDDITDNAVAITWQRRSDPLHKERFANTRRIVACVNACAGIDTAYLEKFGGTTFNDFKRVKQQRDDLLAALKEYFQAGDASLYTVADAMEGTRRFEHTEKSLRDLISSIEGSAA